MACGLFRRGSSCTINTLTGPTPGPPNRDGSIWDAVPHTTHELGSELALLHLELDRLPEKLRLDQGDGTKMIKARNKDSFYTVLVRLSVGGEYG